MLTIMLVLVPMLALNNKFSSILGEEVSTIIPYSEDPLILLKRFIPFSLRLCKVFRFFLSTSTSTSSLYFVAQRKRKKFMMMIIPGEKYIFKLEVDLIRKYFFDRMNYYWAEFPFTVELETIILLLGIKTEFSNRINSLPNSHFIFFFGAAEWIMSIKLSFSSSIVSVACGTKEKKFRHRNRL